jgi:2-keto-4-pentenoate hydratase/2-oxohepta-3-ene-1,7-dioic acid hydratase in catechol pathway
MKLLRYGAIGAEKPGAVDRKGTLRDLSGHVADLAGAALLPESIAKLRTLDLESLPAVSGQPRLGACVGSVGKFIAIGLNYADHAAESGVDVPKEPVIFMKATSSICGPSDTVTMPRNSTKCDWEVELACVIGKPGKYIKEADALSHIAGFCVVNDVSERGFQLEGTGQWVKGKSADTFGPVGPWLVTPDEIADVQNLDMFLDVNGERMQTGSTRTMIFNASFLVAYCSKFMTLEPGDVITTGTPPGVGMAKKPPRFLQPGDRVRLGIAGLGEQNQRVVAHSA